MSSDRDFEAVNALAMDQISRLERGETMEVVPQVHYNTQRGSLWDSESDHTKRWSPSGNPNAGLGRGVPVAGDSRGASTYGNNSRYSYNYTASVDSPEALYRRTLNAVFKDTRNSSKVVSPESPSQTQLNSSGVVRRKVKKEKSMINSQLSDPSFVHGGGMCSFKSSFKGKTKPLPKEQYVAESVHTPTKTVQMVRRKPLLGDETKTNFTAIALSSVARMATTLVASWAREKGVPYHLL